MPNYDVIVLGLGGMGSAAALHLAKRGLRVLGLDRYTSPHHLGSSHGQTRVIRQAYFAHPAYVPLLLRAYELWRELEFECNQTLLQITGGLMIGEPDSEVVQGSLRSAQAHGLPHELLTAREINRRHPAFRTRFSTVALFEKNAGIVFCEDAVQYHLWRAGTAGADLHWEEPVLSWHTDFDDAPICVKTHRATYLASQLVITPGAWAPDFLGALGAPLVVERQNLFWFTPKSHFAHFTPDRLPIYIIQQPDGCTPYGFPALHGPEAGAKIAFYRKPSRELCSPETVDRATRPDDLHAIREAIREYIPALDGECVSSTVCMYTLTPDLHFMIGPHPKSPQVTIAAGFSGHGFKFCSVVGEIVADLVRTGKTRHPIDLFRPDRFQK